MDSVFVEAGYSGLESAEKNVFDNFLEILKHPFFYEQFKKKYLQWEFQCGSRLQTAVVQFYEKRVPVQVFLDIYESFGCRYFKMVP